MTQARSAPLEPVQLRCEYLADPIGLNETQPRLQWLLAGTGTETPRDASQKSYRILVASSPDLLGRDQGDLWDSGEVASDETTFIVYGGRPLVSRERCYWKVRCRDNHDRLTAWSRPASWEMGLLAPADWQAKWIDTHTLLSIPRPHVTLTVLGAHCIEGVFGKPRDVTALIQGLVKNDTLSVPVDSATLGGDASAPTQQLWVAYSVNGIKLTGLASRGQTLVLPSPKRDVPYLRKDFTLAKPVARARVYATALGLYELRLNGHRVGDHVFAPDWTDYTKRVRYQAYDVTSLLKSGANTWAGMLGNGWYAGHIGNGGFQAWGTEPALFAQLEVTYRDGTTERIVTDASWKAHAGPVISSDFMLGEDYDARKEIPGWDAPGLDTSSWAAVTERDEAPRAIDDQVDQPVRATAELKPIAVKKVGAGSIYDLGQNMVGFVRLKVDEPAGTLITLRHAEMLNPDGTLYTANLRGAPSIDTYICRGGGVETWQPRFTFHGFRYVELSGLTGKPRADAVTGIVLRSDFPLAGRFACDLGPINQLMSNIQWGMHGNYLSVPTDCPQRDERMGWMGDAQVFIRSAAYHGDIAAFMTKWLVDVDDAQLADGQFTDVSPSPHGEGKGNGGVPAWSDAGVICPWTIYRMYGDTRILQRHLPNMKRWVDWCEAHSEGHLRLTDRGPDYGDWLAQGETTPKDLIGTAYFAYSTSLVARACRVLHDPEADKYQQLADAIKAAFVQKYVSPDGRIGGDTQSDYAMALRFDLLPQNLRAKAGQYLAENAARHGHHLTTGFIGVSYLLPALCAEGQTAEAFRLFEQDTFPSWLFSVKHGATTIWERWDGWTPDKGFQDPGMNSFNHYSLGSCAEWMYDTLAGIDLDPEVPGFKRIVIHPTPGGTIRKAEAIYDSINGKISTKWALVGTTFKLHVTVPANTKAVVVLPTADEGSVELDGEPVPIQHPPKNSASGPAAVTLDVGSGDYNFTCRFSADP